MRLLLTIGTLCLVGCFAVDAVSTPYGEERPGSSVLQTVPHEPEVAPARCRPDGAFTRREEFYARADTPVFGVRLLPDESVAYGTILVDGEWALARISPPGKDPVRADFELGTFAGYPSPTADGDVVYFARFEGVVGTQRRGEVYVSRRGADGVFATSKRVPVATANEETTPYVTPQADALYFTRYHVDHYIILRVALPAVEFSESGVFASGVEPPGDNVNPVVTGDELTMFFAARNARGDLDVWTAHRASKNDLFGDTRAISELRTEADDVPSWISPDGCVLYFERWEDKTHSRVIRAYRE